MPEWLRLALSQYGYAIVFLGVLLENAGVPVPGETILLAAGFLAHQGLFSLPWVIALVGYLFGQSWGLLHRWAGRAGLFAVAAVVAVVLIVVGRRYWSRLLAKAERWVPAALALHEVILAGANLAAIGLFVKIAEDV